MKSIAFQVQNQLLRRSIPAVQSKSAILPPSSISSSSNPYSLVNLFKTYATIVPTPKDGEKVALNTIRDNPGARKKKRIWGRGIGSGRGKRSGRGNKGWLNRHGAGRPGPPGFEGGQTPFIQIVPKHGHGLSGKEKKYAKLNLDRLQHWIDSGRIDASKPITIRELFESRCIHGVKDGVALLGGGANDLKQKIDIQVTKASKSAIDRIEELGGSIVTVYQTPLHLRHLIHPEKFIVPPRPAIPRKANDVAYYTSTEKRGNLLLTPLADDPQKYEIRALTLQELNDRKK